MAVARTLANFARVFMHYRSLCFRMNNVITTVCGMFDTFDDTKARGKGTANGYGAKSKYWSSVHAKGSGRVGCRIAPSFSAQHIKRAFARSVMR